MYNTQVRDESRRIFPRDKQGKRFVCYLVRRVIRCEHPSGDAVEFRLYRHHGQFGWKDSRQSRPVTIDFVLAELARMLGDGQQATNLVAECLV